LTLFCGLLDQLTYISVAFGPSTTGLLRNLTTSLRPALSSDCEIIVSVLCHEAGISAWVALAKSLGVTIKWWMPSGGVGDPNARLTVESLKPLLSPKTRLVTCGHVSNIIGSIHPIREFADLVHTIPGAMICVDGVAWAPHRPVDVKALDVDFYVFSWYKVFGPHFGQIYARRSTQQRYMTSLNHYFFDPSTLDVKLRLGTNCFELEHCLVPIIRYINSIGWDNIIAHETALTEELLKYLTSRPDLYTVYGEPTSDAKLRVSLISFVANQIPTDIIAREIHNKSNCRIGSGDNYSARLVHDILKRGDDGVLRVSLVHYNTIDEVKKFITTLDQVVHSHMN
jgi:selenocysteine lyase/cysteine desulfurase